VDRHDVVIVGARVAGSPLAIELARAGWDVLLIDRDEFPSDTLSTNGVWPNGLARLDALGALDLLCERHSISFLEHRFRVFEHEISGPFTPIGGHSLCMGPRRRALDSVLLDTAVAAGAKARLGERVRGLVGAGTDADPVRGVVTADGETIEARWVFGADGRASAVAGALGVEKTETLRGEMGMLFAYWADLPETPFMHFHAEADGVLSWGNVEDGASLVIINCRPELTRGGAEARTAAYLEGIRGFPATLDPEWLDDAERVSEVFVAPETMLRGYFRRASGPGWALVGDAGHFKHPSTAQGIGDALTQAHHVAEALLGEDPELKGYEAWRNRRAKEAYEWSFNFARFPRRGGGDAVFAGLAGDPEAAQDFRDVLSRRVDPRTELFTKERLDRWFAAAAS
jgi:2-polyprenyl-6-methoxyphenol hydroxylase-like FAD-dependent oxidoreductase